MEATGDTAETICYDALLVVSQRVSNLCARVRTHDRVISRIEMRPGDDEVCGCGGRERVTGSTGSGGQR